MPSSTETRKKKYKRERRALIKSLGKICSVCRKEKRYAKLEFHHTHPKQWVNSKLNRNQRLRRVIEDIAKGHVVLACGTCNKKLGVPVDPDWDWKSDPFFD